MEKDPSAKYVKKICDLYGEVYDDREEDSKPGGLDWMPGIKADHEFDDGEDREGHPIEDRGRIRV